MRPPLRPLLRTPVLAALALGGLAVLTQPAPPVLGGTVLASAESITLPPTAASYRVVPGRHVRSEAWVLPVRDYELTARFADESGHWSSGSHTGLDFAAPVGTPIRSIADGEVVSTAYDGAYGATTVVRLDDGTQVWFCHQDRQDVAPGQRVVGGQVIGTVGASGNVTGPHLHLEIRPGGGDPVDPAAVLAGHRVEP